MAQNDTPLEHIEVDGGAIAGILGAAAPCKHPWTLWAAEGLAFG